MSDHGTLRPALPPLQALRYNIPKFYERMVRLTQVMGAGGILANPIEALARIIAGLKDAQGRVTVPGFYEGVPELDAHTRREIAKLPYDEAREAAQIARWSRRM